MKQRVSVLTKEENELYMKIVKYGTMDDMFDFAYVIGRERLAKENLKILNKSKKRYTKGEQDRCPSYTEDRIYD